jgi:hypothetical protein
MRLYAKCQKELYGNIVTTYDHGFICHKPVTKDGGIYVQLCYVDEPYRKEGLAKKMLIDTCDKYEATYVTGFIDLRTDNYKQTLMVHLNAGYDIIDANRDSLIVSITKERLINGR